MPPNKPPKTLPRWVRWPAVFLLCLAWALVVPVAYLAGGLGTGARRLADVLVNLVDELVEG